MSELRALVMWCAVPSAAGAGGDATPSRVRQFNDRGRLFQNEAGTYACGHAALTEEGGGGLGSTCLLFAMQVFFDDDIDDSKYCGHVYGLGSTTYPSSSNNGYTVLDNAS